MKYASFGQRFVAACIDGIVLLPLMFLQTWLGGVSKFAAILLVVPMTAAYCAYSIYCHGRFGQTLGKRAMVIRVLRTTGERIGWKEAWRRSSVDLLFAALAIISSLIALSIIPDAEYYGVGWKERALKLQALQPGWLAWTSVAAWIWIWSEVVVMLFNKRKRALHDFLAGTVVVSELPVPEGQTPAVQPVG